MESGLLFPENSSSQWRGSTECFLGRSERIRVVGPDPRVLGMSPSGRREGSAECGRRRSGRVRIEGPDPGELGSGTRRNGWWIECDPSGLWDRTLPADLTSRPSREARSEW